MTEICVHDGKLTLDELDQNLKENCHNDQHAWLNLTENRKYNFRSSFIVYFCRCGTFGQIQSFLVEFNYLIFVVVIFQSCSNCYGLSDSVIFKPIFGHIDSVKLTSLGYRGRKKIEKFDLSKNFELPINLDSFVKAFFCCWLAT